MSEAEAGDGSTTRRPSWQASGALVTSIRSPCMRGLRGLRISTESGRGCGFCVCSGGRARRGGGGGGGGGEARRGAGGEALGGPGAGEGGWAAPPAPGEGLERGAHGHI